MATTNSIPKSTQLLYEEMVILGGGLFRAYWDEDLEGFEPLVMFDSPQTEITLCIPTRLMSADAVRRRIRLSDDFHLFLRDLENHQWARR